jgi:cyclin H
MLAMIEDDAYRTSSQYRYWSYTREALAALRQGTNALASERVIAAIRRSKAEHTSPENDGAEPTDKPIETLTTDEELKIVKWGCARIVEMGQVMEPPVPMEIRV